MQVSGALAKTFRILSFCVTEERTQRPAGGLNAAWFAGVKAPAAIGILQSLQKRDEFIAKPSSEVRALQLIWHFENILQPSPAWPSFTALRKIIVLRGL